LKMLKSILIIIAFGLLLWGYMYLQTRNVAARSCEFAITDLPREFDGFTILHISDLHSKRFGPDQSELMELIKEKDFDIVAVTGDLINKKHPETGPMVELINRLQEKAVYFVPGNHEWWNGFRTEPLLEENRVRIMRNSHVKIAKGDRTIYLAGVDDPHTGRDNVELAMVDVPDKAAVVLLAHSPIILPQAVEKGIDLVLCGHTHGGQVRLPFVGALMVPGQGLFPKWDHGVFRDGKTIMLINDGLGESGLPIRFLTTPEIVFITLRTPDE